MGTVIGLSDGAGTEVADFRYDSFGNLRSSEGNSSNSTGGDFRFQGQWLESESGLYYFRARDYDSKTGLFLSRDPVNIIETEPESFNPYQFVYNNPYIYSDPSGSITLAELATASKIEDILRSLQKYAVSEAREYLLDRAKGIAGDFVKSVIKQLLPFTAFDEVKALNQAKKYLDAGINFENILVGAVCEVISSSFSQFQQSIWLQSRISTKGKPINDGFPCGSVIPNNQWFYDQKLWGSRPDFIIKNGGPRTTDQNPKAYLIGDVKLKGKTVANSVYGNQWKAIMNYAKFENRHQYQPIALYITLWKPTQAQFKKAVKKASQEGVNLAIVSISSRTDV